MNADDSHSDHQKMVIIVSASNRVRLSNRHASGFLLGRGFKVI
jgi:hypothetical protein